MREIKWKREKKWKRARLGERAKLKGTERKTEKQSGYTHSGMGSWREKPERGEGTKASIAVAATAFGSKGVGLRLKANTPPPPPWCTDAVSSYRHRRNRKQTPRSGGRVGGQWRCTRRTPGDRKVGGGARRSRPSTTLSPLAFSDVFVFHFTHRPFDFVFFFY